MKHQERFFADVRKTKIYYQSCLPEGAPKAVLLIAHSLTEHIGQDMNVINYYVPKC